MQGRSAQSKTATSSPPRSPGQCPPRVQTVQHSALMGTGRTGGSQGDAEGAGQQVTVGEQQVGGGRAVGKEIRD